MENANNQGLLTSIATTIWECLYRSQVKPICRDVAVYQRYSNHIELVELSNFRMRMIP